MDLLPHKNLDVISAYSREEAIKDGVLVDVSKMGKEAGFKCPIALTNSVYAKYVLIPEGVEHQDEIGRLWDILYMLFITTLRKGAKTKIEYTVYVNNDNQKPSPVNLKAVCGSGDQGEMVITIMLPNED